MQPSSLCVWLGGESPRILDKNHASPADTDGNRQADRVACMQPSPVKAEAVPQPSHAPAFEASFPEHTQKQHDAPPQHAQQPQRGQQMGTNNPFGASAFGAAAFPAPSGQAGQASARSASSGIAYGVPATPAPSLATGATVEAAPFPHALPPPGSNISYALILLFHCIRCPMGSGAMQCLITILLQEQQDSEAEIAAAHPGTLTFGVAGLPGRALSGIPPSPTHRPPSVGRRTTSSEVEAPLPVPAGASSDGFDSHAFETSFPPVPESIPQNLAGIRNCSGLGCPCRLASACVTFCSPSVSAEVTFRCAVWSSVWLPGNAAMQALACNVFGWLNVILCGPDHTPYCNNQADIHAAAGPAASSAPSASMKAPPGPARQLSGGSGMAGSLAGTGSGQLGRSGSSSSLPPLRVSSGSMQPGASEGNVQLWTLCQRLCLICQPPFTLLTSCISQERDKPLAGWEIYCGCHELIMRLMLLRSLAPFGTHLILGPLQATSARPLPAQHTPDVLIDAATHSVHCCRPPGACIFRHGQLCVWDVSGSGTTSHSAHTRQVYFSRILLQGPHTTAF